MATAVPVLLVACCLLLSGCGSGDPFSYVPVSGAVCYEDGALIPGEVVLMFYPQSAPLDAKTHPRCGTAIVDPASGRFGKVTSHKPGDGLVRGKHKVTLVSLTLSPLPPEVVPPEYGDPFKTPLEVDTSEAPFHLKVPKPST